MRRMSALVIMVIVVITIISPGPFSLLLPGFSTHVDAHTKTKCGVAIGGDQ
jgi:hypothetical protein